jgi:hypothetical protein
MKIRTAPLLVWLYLTASIAGQTHLTHRVAELLPSDARIIEAANVPLHAAKARVLVLWMSAPKPVNSTWDSAPDNLYGDHWYGPTFLSLIDPSSAKLISTVRIRANNEPPDERRDFAVPFFTYDGFYHVPHPNKDRKGKPLLLRLRDLTGEGVAGQFVLFDHVVSGIAAGSVLGYSARSDTAVQYPVERTQNTFNPVIDLWAIQVFDREPTRAGYWNFTWEAGHGEWDWIDEEVHFDAARQLFVQKVTTRPYPGFAEVHCSLDKGSLMSFLRGMQNVAPDQTEIDWLRDFINKTPSNAIADVGMVPTFKGTREPLSLAFQVSASGEIRIEFTADSSFAAALRAGLQKWCGAN